MIPESTGQMSHSLHEAQEEKQLSDQRKCGRSDRSRTPDLGGPLVDRVFYENGKDCGRFISLRVFGLYDACHSLNVMDGYVEQE